mgnify:FL=1
MVSSFQIKKIHTLKNLLSIDNDLYIDMLMSFGVQSSKNLTFTEANILLEILEEKAVAQNLWVKQPKKYESLKRNENMASSAQLRMIESLWREIAYINNDKFSKSSLRKFLKNKFKIDDIMFLTKTKATKVIQGIMAIKKSAKKGVATLRT